MKTVFTVDVLVNAVLASEYGVIVILPLAAKPRLVSADVVIVAAPPSLVTIDKTYLVGALPAVPAVFCSQPQVFANGSNVLELLWMVSEMLVRHCEPAKIASDTFARIV